jgi:hypothetical protein
LVRQPKEASTAWGLCAHQPMPGRLARRLLRSRTRKRVRS